MCSELFGCKHVAVLRVDEAPKPIKLLVFTPHYRIVSFKTAADLHAVVHTGGLYVCDCIKAWCMTNRMRRVPGRVAGNVAAE